MINHLAILSLFAALTVADANAADENGRFILGGGVGMSKCPAFLNAMATARANGGADNIKGLPYISAYTMYVLGFSSGFNMSTEGVYDIFKDYGDKAGFYALYAIEPWCQQNPDGVFGDGLVALAAKLKAAAAK